MDNDVEKWFWHSGLVNPQMWAMSANRLARSAEVLWEQWEKSHDYAMHISAASDPNEAGLHCRDIELCTVAFMLAGFAIENVIKGLWVDYEIKSCPIVEGDKRLDKLKTHNLIKLAKEAKIIFNAQELVLIAKLQTELTWGGRYSRPLNPDEFYRVYGGKCIRSFCPEDWDEFATLYMRIYRQLRQQTKISFPLSATE